MILVSVTTVLLQDRTESPMTPSHIPGNLHPYQTTHPQTHSLYLKISKKIVSNFKHFSFSYQIKCCFSRLKFTKMRVRIATREDSEQTASSEAISSLIWVHFFVYALLAGS